MADNVLNYFTNLGPFNSSNTMTFSKEDSIIDADKINAATKDSSKNFLIFKDALLNRGLVKANLNLKDLSSTKIVISVKRNDSHGQEIEISEYKSAAEGGDISTLSVKHQFGDSTHSDLREIHFQHQNGDGKVLDSFDCVDDANHKTLSDKVKHYLHIPNNQQDNSGNVADLAAEQLTDQWLNSVLGAVSEFDSAYAPSA